MLGSFSHFKNGWIGTHQLKGGGEIFLTSETEIWRKGYAGDVLHVLRGGQPAEVYVFETPSQSESGFGPTRSMSATPGGRTVASR